MTDPSRRLPSQSRGLSQTRLKPEPRTVSRVNPFCVIAFAMAHQIGQEKTQ